MELGPFMDSSTFVSLIARMSTENFSAREYENRSYRKRNGNRSTQEASSLATGVKEILPNYTEG